MRGQSGEQHLPPLIRAGDKAVSIKGERELGDHGDQGEQRSAQYLSANCVIFTYVAGDISKLVDDHFTKALGQNSDRGEFKETQIIFHFAKSLRRPSPAVCP